MHIRQLIRFFLALLLSLLGVGCQKKSSSKPQRYLNVSFTSEVRSFDPRIGIDAPSVFSVKMLFEGLIRLDINGKLQPAIAQSYEVSPDGKTYTFYLRSCKWTNGEEITAHDFEYSWKKIIEPEGDYMGVHNFYPIKNVRSTLNKKCPIDEVGIKALNAKTLRVELENPTPYFLDVLATPSFSPVNARVDKEDPQWATKTGNAFVSNGPFHLEEHRLENEIFVKKNPLYWDAASVKLPGIKIAIINDVSTQLQLFEKGRLEWLGMPLSKVPLDAIDHLKKTQKVHFAPTLGVYWYFLNTESFPFNNRKIRRAFACAINREEIIDHILQGEETAAMGILPQFKTTFFPDNDPSYAIELFNKALKDIGITKEELPPLTINYSNALVHERVAEALQEQWQKVFGITIKLEKQEWKSHYSKLQKGDYQIGGMAWHSWLRDLIYMLQTFRYQDDGINMSRWQHKSYQALLKASEEELDNTKRLSYFRQAEALLMHEMPVIPIYFTTICYYKSDALKDYYLSDRYEVDFRCAYLVDPE